MSITISEIKSKYNGKLINIDQAFGNQCYDLSIAIARDISGIQDLSIYCDRTGGVIDFATSDACREAWANYGFKWVDNDTTNPDQVPNCPAIFVEAPFYSEYGHTGAILESFVGQDRLITIEQNTGGGDGQGKDDATVIKDRNFIRIIGWYEYQEHNKPEKETFELDLSGLNKAEVDTILVKDVVGIANTYRDRHTEIDELKATVEELKDENQKITKQLRDLNFEFTDLHEEHNGTKELLATSQDYTRSQSVKIEDLQTELNNNSTPAICPPTEQSVEPIENTLIPTISEPQKFSWDKFVVGLSKSGVLHSIIFALATLTVTFLAKLGLNLTPEQVANLILSMLPISGVPIVIQGGVQNFKAINNK